MRPGWTLALFFLQIFLSMFPLVYFQIVTSNNEETMTQCSYLSDYFAFLFFQFSLFPFIVYKFLHFLRSQRANFQDIRLSIAAVSATICLFFCSAIRLRTELLLNDPNTTETPCFSSFLQFYCLFITRIYSIIMGTIWMVVMALFLRYGLLSSLTRRKTGGALSLFTWVYIGYVIYKVQTSKGPGECQVNIFAGSVRALINCGIFFILYFLTMCYDEIDRFGIHLQVVTSLFLKLFIPVNLFWYVEGVEALNKAREQSSGCISDPFYFCLELVLYEWIVFSLLFSLAGCVLALKYRLTTIENLRANPFLMLLGLSEEDIAEGPRIPQSAENNVALLNPTVIDTTKHPGSFFEKAVCPICWESFSMEQRVVYFPGCEHVFHEPCIKAWARAHNTCPTCRRNLPESTEMAEISVAPQ